MKLKSLFAALLIVAAAPSMASIVSVSNLGNLSVPGVAGLGNDFSQAGTYQDDYNFSINQAATAGGLVLELDLFSKLNIDVTQVSLTSLGGGASYAADMSPLTYDFGFLGAGDYTLSIFSTVTNSFGFNIPVAYAGSLALGTARDTGVPEPGTLALFGLGLVGVALVTRRRAIRS